MDISLMKNPDGMWEPHRGDHHLNSRISPQEWEALFIDVLEVPYSGEQLPGEDGSNYLDRQYKRFAEALSAKGFPMLGRISEFYGSASYLSSEVHSLRNECLRVQQLTDNVDALQFVKKLLFACERAECTNSGISLQGD